MGGDTARDRFGHLLVVVTDVVLAALRLWADCVVIPV